MILFATFYRPKNLISAVFRDFFRKYTRIIRQIIRPACFFSRKKSKAGVIFLANSSRFSLSVTIIPPIQEKFKYLFK